MPNWCNNSLYITGDKESIQQFYDDNRTEECDLQFKKSVPSTEHTCESQVKAWGTKWDISECCSDMCERSISYSFDTAWSPPENWLSSIARLYPDLSFNLEYRETGVGFQGVITAKGDDFNHEEQEFIPDEEDE